MNQREIYLIRHGATALNKESGSVDRIRGWKDIPLSEEGRKEAKQLAKKLKESGIEILISSDLSRATDTADAIKETTGAEIKLSKKLRPWDVGEYTGKESSTVHPVMVIYATKKPDQKIPGGESFEEFKDRIFGGLKEHLNKDKNKVLGLVTHHRIERLLKSWISNGSRKNHSIDFDKMFQHGEKTAHAEKIKISLDAL